MPLARTHRQLLVLTVPWSLHVIARAQGPRGACKQRCPSWGGLIPTLSPHCSPVPKSPHCPRDSSAGHLQPSLVLPCLLPWALAQPLCPPGGGCGPGPMGAPQPGHLPIPCLRPAPLEMLSRTQRRQRGRLLLAQWPVARAALATLRALSQLRPQPRGTVRVPSAGWKCACPTRGTASARLGEMPFHLWLLVQLGLALNEALGGAARPPGRWPHPSADSRAVGRAQPAAR